MSRRVKRFEQLAYLALIVAAFEAPLEILRATADTPGTPSYMAPELLAGSSPGDERSDVFALGVTLYRMWSGGAYPYGEVEPFSRPRFRAPAPLLARRPDLPAWLDLSSVSGDIRIGLDSTTQPEPGEPYITVRARTASGDIAIHRA